MSREERLRSLSDRTKSLLEDLDGARQDVLSVADLNRSLRQVLRNQVAILDSLVAESSDPNARTTAQLRSASNGSGPRITLREKDGDPEVVEPSPMARTPLPHDEPDDPSQRDLTGVDRLGTHELKTMLGPLGDPESGSEQQGSVAERVLNEGREVDTYEARTFVEAFDNRDKIYDRGLEKLNRWVNGGQAGTPFQWRGDKAYLNVNGANPEGVRRYEQQLMKRMGFNRRVGRLVVPELDGDIVVYERP